MNNEFGFGIGGIITSILLGAFSAWQSWNAARKAKLAIVFAQNIALGRAVIKATVPDGPMLEANYLERIKKDQRAAGVKLLATDVVDATVDKSVARAAAAEVALAE